MFSIPILLFFNKKNAYRLFIFFNILFKILIIKDKIIFEKNLVTEKNVL